MKIPAQYCQTRIVGDPDSKKPSSDGCTQTRIRAQDTILPARIRGEIWLTIIADDKRMTVPHNTAKKNKDTTQTTEHDNVREMAPQRTAKKTWAFHSQQQNTTIVSVPHNTGQEDQGGEIPKEKWPKKKKHETCSNHCHISCHFYFTYSLRRARVIGWNIGFFFVFLKSHWSTTWKPPCLTQSCWYNFRWQQLRNRYYNYTGDLWVWGGQWSSESGGSHTGDLGKGGSYGWPSESGGSFWWSSGLLFA